MSQKIFAKLNLLMKFKIEDSRLFNIYQSTLALSHYIVGPKSLLYQGGFVILLTEDSFISSFIPFLQP